MKARLSQIWNKLSVLRGLAPTERVVAAEIRATESPSEVDLARRWYRARTTTPELVADVIRMGGLLTPQPMQAGEVLPLDPYRLAYEAGRRDMALQLCAVMSLTIEELNYLMEDPNA